MGEGNITELELYQGYQSEPMAKLTDFTQDSDSGYYHYSWDVSSLQAGKYKLTAIAYDTAGNASVNDVDITIQ